MSRYPRREILVPLAPLVTLTSRPVGRRRSASLRSAAPALPGGAGALAGWWALVVGASLLTCWPGDPVVATAAGFVALVVLPGLTLARCLPWGATRPAIGELTLAGGAAGAT